MLRWLYGLFVGHESELEREYAIFRDELDSVCYNDPIVHVMMTHCRMKGMNRLESAIFIIKRLRDFTNPIYEPD